VTTPILELRRLRKTYGSTVAIDDVSLGLGHGEFLTLLGPSGSGKTTTLLTIAGLIEPSDGSILLDGRPIEALPPYRRDIGVVFQNYALFPHLTAARNVAFPLEMRGVARADIDRRVTRTLGLVGLPDQAARYPRELSGGQQQRVALARAMVFEPKILLMDEPLGALDRKLREQMQIEILHLHRELGISVVYVTHDQEEALVMSDRIAVFNRGRIEQIGLASELYERPATRFVAGFLGESNFFSATVGETVDGFCRLNGGSLALRARSGGLLDGGLLDGGLSAGSRAVVAVRPERIRISDGAVGPADENGVSGVLREVIYLGRSRRFVVRLASGQEVSSYEQVGTDRDLAPGSAVHLSWRAEDATALPED
jgi:putative spermidine/putrescine transport system ATP-binding protein